MTNLNIKPSVIATILLIAMYPALTHSAYLFEMPALRFAAILGVLTGVFLSGLLHPSIKVWAVYTCASVGLILLAIKQSDIYLTYIPPVIIPLSLLIIFGKTLLPGKEALITAIGEASRGPLSLAMRRYTYGLTAAWCALFITMAALPTLFLLTDKQALWFWFTNVFNYLIVGFLFIGEFYLRKKIFPNHNHPGFLEYLKIIYLANIRR